MNKTMVLTVLGLLVSTPSLWSQDLDDFVRRPGETAESYIARVKPASETLTYQILETTAWDAKNPSLEPLDLLGDTFLSFEPIVGEEEAP